MITGRSVVVLLALGALGPVPTAAADEAAAMCQGVPATLVGDGTYGRSLQGTDGPDVIVTNRAHFTDGGAGDDLICVTGRVDVGHSIVVLDGAGDDVTQNFSQTLGDYHFTFHLQEGTDRFIGGPAPEDVFSHGGPDDISTGAGSDFVGISDSDAPFAGAVRLGADGGGVTLYDTAAMTPEAVLDGGDGRSGLSIPRDLPGAWEIDNAAGTATRDGRPALHWTGFTGFGWQNNPVRFHGTDRAEQLSATRVIEADLGRGDDSATVAYAPSADPGAIDGGAGTDTLSASGSADYEDDQAVRVDASAGTVTFGDGSPTTTFTAFESLRAWVNGSSDVVTVIGTDGSDDLEALGCHVAMEGRAGDDTMRVRSDPDASCRRDAEVHGGAGDDRISAEAALQRLYGDQGDDTFDAYRGLHANGGPGDDVFRGGVDKDILRGGSGNDLMQGKRGDDVLAGQLGEDVARGGPGRDLCRAETRYACESR